MSREIQIAAVHPRIFQDSRFVEMCQEIALHGEWFLGWLHGNFCARRSNQSFPAAGKFIAIARVPPWRDEPPNPARGARASIRSALVVPLAVARGG